MQDPKKSTPARKAWYERAMEMALLCKNFTLSKPIDEIPTRNNATISLWKSSSSNSEISISKKDNNNNNNSKVIRKCSLLLSVTTSLTRVCLCVPISSYTPSLLQANNVWINERTRSSKNSIYYPRTISEPRAPPTTIRLEERRAFRGKSLRDDVLMRRFVIEEESMWHVIRRRNTQMEVIRRRSGITRKQLGPSPLSRMVLADNNDDI